jgi:hypothetical protein
MPDDERDWEGLAMGDKKWLGTSREPMHCEDVVAINI